MTDHWIFAKHPVIELTSMTAGDFRLVVVPEAGFPLYAGTGEDLIDWARVDNAHHIHYYDAWASENLASILGKSALATKDFVYAELQSNIPVVKIPAAYFVDNWEDIVDASAGMGMIVASTDFKLMMEFSSDHSWLLHANFPLAQ